MLLRPLVTAALCAALNAGIPGCGFFGGGADPAGPAVPGPGTTDRPGATAGPDRPERPFRPVITAGNVTTIRVSVAIYTVPAGWSGGDAEIWAAVDEDWGGIREKTVLGHNGLRAGLIREGGRDGVLRRLASKAVTEVRRSDAVVGERDSLSIPLRRSADRRAGLFVFGLGGALAGRQYGLPQTALQLALAVQPTEPGHVHLDGAPAVTYLPPDSDPRRAASEPFRDLTPSELLQLLPSARAAGEAAAAGARDDGPVTELLTGVRLRGRAPSGGTLLLAPVRDAGESPCLGRLMLVDGPADVGVETVLLMTFEVLPGRPVGS